MVPKRTAPHGLATQNRNDHRLCNAQILHLQTRRSINVYCVAGEPIFVNYFSSRKDRDEINLVQEPVEHGREDITDRHLALSPVALESGR